MKILSYYNDRLIDHKTFDEILLGINKINGFGALIRAQKKLLTEN